MLYTFVIALLLQQTPSSVPAPQKLWEATLPSRVLSLAIAHGGACVAVLTETSAEVRNESGRVTWSSPIVSSQQDIGFGRIAVSPQCDWTAVFVSRNARPPMLQTFSRNGSRMSISLDAMVGLDPNAANVSSLSISPDGRLLAVGFEAGRVWLVTRSGTIQNRLGPLTAPQIDAEFAPDSKRLVMKGWFATGLMAIEDGQWLWESKARNLVASRNLTLFATLSAPMHGPQGGDIAILDAQGTTVWQQMAWNASMAIAPDGSFVVFGSTPERAKQPTTAPVVPELSDAPEVRILDKTGKLLAHSVFNGNLIGVSADSKCILLRLTASQDLIGVNRRLVGVWRLPKAREPLHEGTLILEQEGNNIRASRMPTCR